MGIAHRNLKKATGVRTSNLQWDYSIANGAQPAYVPGALVGLSTPGSTVPGTTNLWAKWRQNPLLTFTSVGSLTASFRVTGENQFGELTTEVVSFAGASPQALTTQNYYRRITSIKVISTSANFNAADTLGVGYTNVNPVIPMLAKLTAPKTAKAAADVSPAGSIMAVLNSQQITQAAQFPFQVALDPKWTISITGSPAGVGSGAIMVVHLADGDGTL